MLGGFVDLRVPVVHGLQVELEVRAHQHLPAGGAQLGHALLVELQPGAIAVQLEGFAGLGWQRLALAQRHLQAGVFQAATQACFGRGITNDAQCQGWALAHQQVLGRFAEGALALILEGQGGAVLGLFVHAALARIEVHAHMAAEAEYGGRLQAFQAFFHLRFAGDFGRRRGH